MMLLLLTATTDSGETPAGEKPWAAWGGHVQESPTQSPWLTGAPRKQLWKYMKTKRLEMEEASQVKRISVMLSGSVTRCGRHSGPFSSLNVCNRFYKSSNLCDDPKAKRWYEAATYAPFTAPVSGSQEIWMHLWTDVSTNKLNCEPSKLTSTAALLFHPPYPCISSSRLGQGANHNILTARTGSHFPVCTFR